MVKNHIFHERVANSFERIVKITCGMSDNSFTQSSDVNRLIGDVERKFEHISAEMDQHPQFQELLSTFAQRTNVNTFEKPIGVHQIRVICSNDQSGSPAPEGIHQDGFDYVGIFCIKRDNISGAYTQVFSSPVDQHPHMSTTIEENQFIILNDRHFYHYVTETLPYDSSRDGVRDVFVFTA